MAKKPTRSRLGRGLSSLMQVDAPAGPNPPTEAATDQPAKPQDRSPEADDQGRSQASTAPSPAVPPEEGPLREVSPDRIDPNPHQPRKQFSSETLAELAASLKANGVIQPLVVKAVGDRFELIAGERRLRAAKVAQLPTVPVIVREADRYTQAQLALVENIQRQDLNPVERAEAYQALLDELGLTQSELAQRVGEDRSTIANHLRLLDLTEAVREQVAVGLLPMGHAKVLAGVTDEAQQKKLADLVIRQNLTVRNLERILKGAEEGSPTRDDEASNRPDGLTIYFNQVAEAVSRQLGMNANLTPSGRGKGGKLTLHFKSPEQFDRIMHALGVDADDLPE